LTDTSPARIIARAMIFGLAVIAVLPRANVASAHAVRRGHPHAQTRLRVSRNGRLYPWRRRPDADASADQHPGPEQASTTPSSVQPFHPDDGSTQASASELGCLTAAVYYEARGESLDGQAAVAQVVLNRVRNPAFPKSICGVVFQRQTARRGCQFSFACDGAMRRRKEEEAWTTAEQIATRALAGFVMPEVGDATHYHVAGLHTSWGPSLMRVAQIGLHVFYQMTDQAKSALGLNGPAQPIAYASMLPTFGIGETHPATAAAAPSAANAPQPPNAAPVISPLAGEPPAPASAGAATVGVTAAAPASTADAS
jgi:spore germination cell wall hydrolase CwlJ-like protein